jgi:hypothetical protein
VFVGQIAGVVTLITGVLSLVFIARPGCKPQPPQDRGIANIGKPQVITPVTFRTYLRKLELPTGTLSAQKLSRVGVMIEFRYHALGFGGKRLPLHWELDDAKTNNLIAEDRNLVITPSTNDETRTFFIWVPVPRTRRSYYVTGKLLRPGEAALLSDFRTGAFAGVGRT